MADYNAKNYTEQGGEKTVIGGELEVSAGAKANIKGDLKMTGDLEMASGSTETVKGDLVIASGGKLKFGTTEIKQAIYVAEVTGEYVTAAEFNVLLNSLRTAGLLAVTQS